MIKKVFKTIFILTLCLSISLPANAGSVQVSDGSAFITKSEMAYELNSLSNRMTQLENSLDSKIDSLVSSYLTRNGIWNGVAQKIKTGGYVVNIAASGQDPVIALHNPPVFDSSYDSTFRWAFQDNIFGNAEFFTANKSVLLVMSLTTYGAYDTTTKTFDNDFRAIFAYRTTSNHAFNQDSRGSYAGWELVDNATGDIKCSVSLGRPEPRENSDVDGTVPARYMARLMLFNYAPYFGLVQCFVNKGDVINQRLRYQLNIGGWTTGLGFFDARAIIPKGYNMVINYCNVY